MKFIGFSNLEKKDSPLQYRKQYNGIALLKNADENQIQSKIEFIIEYRATGPMEIQVDLLEEIDYPLLPIIKDIKSSIYNLEKEGKLP